MTGFRSRLNRLQESYVRDFVRIGSGGGRQPLSSIGESNRGFTDRKQLRLGPVAGRRSALGTQLEPVDRSRPISEISEIKILYEKNSIGVRSRILSFVDGRGVASRSTVSPSIPYKRPRRRSVRTCRTWDTSRLAFLPLRRRPRSGASLYRADERVASQTSPNMFGGRNAGAGRGAEVWIRRGSRRC